MKMKRLIILGLFLTLGFFYEANAQNAQSESTKVIRLEIDGKEVKKKYKIFFLSEGKLVEAKKTSTGFIIPAELKNNEELNMLITLGKYKFKVPEIHISKFEEDWVLGVDNKPFSEENASYRYRRRNGKACLLHSFCRRWLRNYSSFN